MTLATEKTWMTGRAERLEYRMLHNDGSWRVLESTASAIYDSNGETDKLVIVNRDITDRKRVEDMLAHQSFHDLLTDLPNRALFLDRLQHSIMRARRHSDHRFSVLFIDLDEFKLLNDGLGHSVGDELLVHIGKQLARYVRDTDTVARPEAETPSIAEEGSVARLGGDEFTVLLEDIADVGNAVRVARRILNKWLTPFIINGQEVVISASIGIAVWSPIYMNSENLVRDAELAMFRAKQSGKARCEVFDPDMHAQAVRRLKLESELRKAIE
jgi:GGDEF domain-containing protein